MTSAKCTEDGINPPTFNFTLYSGSAGEPPTIAFELPEECWPDSDYDGVGIFEIDLETLLKNTVNNHLRFDEGRGTHKTVALLREYANRLEMSAEQHRHLWLDDEATL